MNERGHDVCAWHPDILDAVPAPVARLPDIAGGRWGRRHLDHGRGRGRPTTTPTRAKPGTGASVRAAAQSKGRIARGIMERFLGKAWLLPSNYLPIGVGLLP